jgi:ABC-type transport system involved in multi-copper enzyme maturation permease subunit
MSDAPRSPGHGFGALVAETLRDAIRRRGLIAAALASVGAALLLQRCGSCDAAVTVQGESVALQDGPLGVVGLMVAFGLVALWTYAVTALLASDGLATALEDGSAESLLARPVSRDVFVGARLVGVWSGAAGMGAALLALVVGIAVTRHGLAGAPALLAIGSVASAALGVAALAMLASLSLPRVATLLLLTALGLAVGGIEVAALLGSADRGVVGAVAAFGPAWLSAPVSALAPWLGHPLPAPPPWPFARGLAWTALSVVGLLVRFRRVELLR